MQAWIIDISSPRMIQMDQDTGAAPAPSPLAPLRVQRAPAVAGSFFDTLQICSATCRPVADWLEYPLTDYCKLDMLQSGPGWNVGETCRELILTRIFNVSIS